MAYREELTLKARGLHKYSDVLESVPEGSLQEAVNVVLDKDNIISPRRGFETLPGTITGAIGSLHTYTDSERLNTLIAHRGGTTLSYYDDIGGTWNDYAGTYDVPFSSEVIRSVESNKNFYFATDKGVQKLDSFTGTPIDAGAPEALNIEIGTDADGSAVLTNEYVTYRAVWGYKDANDNLILGAPSARITYFNDGTANAGATRDVNVVAYIPAPPVDVTWFVQLYRTKGASSDSTGDVMYLVQERNPIAGDITQGFITLTDTTPDELTGAELYTNATQEGIINSNYQPPQCVDMALFQNHMFYANTETRYDYTTTMGSDFPVNTGTITINSQVYTARTAENTAAREFLHVDSVVGGTAAQKVEAMVQSLVKVINANTSNTTLWATYASLENELPGKFRVAERDYGDATEFTVSSSNPGSFVPAIEASAKATNNKFPNRIYFSKPQEPEAVPLLNFLSVGPANDRIQRILPLRSTLLIFTERAIYRMSGTSSSTFQITLLDNTAQLLAPESLVPLNNTACGLFDQGVARVSSTTVQVISRPIEGDLLEIRGASQDKLADLAFGVSYESDRKYMLALPSSSTATTNSIFYVYNTATNSWTTYNLQKSAGIVRPSDDKLYLAEEDTVSRERKDFASTDFADEAIPITVSAVSVDNLTLTTPDIASVVRGYMYYEGGSKFSRVRTVDPLTSTFTVADPLVWTTGAHELRPSIATTITWNPISAKSPNLLKQFSECTLIVETPLQDATLSFSTPTSGGFLGVSIVDTAEGPWGLFPWGDISWGGDPIKTRYRTYVPRVKQKDTYITTKLTQNTVFNNFQVSGLSYYFRPLSNRVGR